MARDEMFKTVSFGGYDKAVVDEYVAETNRSHQNDIADLKTTIGKLSETVRSLQVAKEQVKSAASEDIEKLKLELQNAFEETDATKHKLETQISEKNALQASFDEKSMQADRLQKELEERTAELQKQLDDQKTRADFLATEIEL